MICSNFGLSKWFWRFMMIHVLDWSGQRKREWVGNIQQTSHWQRTVWQANDGKGMWTWSWKLSFIVFTPMVFTAFWLICVVHCFVWSYMSMYFVIGHLGDVLCFGQCIVIFGCWASFFDCFGKHKCYIRLCIEDVNSIIQVLCNTVWSGFVSVENPVAIPLSCHALAQDRLEQVSVDSHGSVVDIHGKNWRSTWNLSWKSNILEYLCQRLAYNWRQFSSYLLWLERHVYVFVFVFSPWGCLALGTIHVHLCLVGRMLWLF